MVEKKKEEQRIHLNLNNLAMPEVIFGEEEEEKPEEDVHKELYIDYSGAVPEIHLKKENKED